jgi:hypothetical protein
MKMSMPQRVFRGAVEYGEVAFNPFEAVHYEHIDWAGSTLSIAGGAYDRASGSATW